MATRSTTGEYAPAPPFYNLGGRNNGRINGAVIIKTIASNEGVKPNMCCAPQTNGDRVAGLAPSKPNSAKSMKGLRPRISF